MSRVMFKVGVLLYPIVFLFSTSPRDPRSECREEWVVSPRCVDGLYILAIGRILDRPINNNYALLYVVMSLLFFGETIIIITFSGAQTD